MRRKFDPDKFYCSKDFKGHDAFDKYTKWSYGAVEEPQMISFYIHEYKGTSIEAATFIRVFRVYKNKAAFKLSKY